MNRPAPRRSSLAGSTPAAPAPQSAPTPAEPVAKAPRKSAAKAPSEQTKPKPKKVGFYQDPDDSARARGAFAHTMGVENVRTLSEFIDRAVMREVKRLEDKYNEGKPFPPRGAGEVPTGRPYE